MKRKILIRFDDFCPTMNWKEWSLAEEILEENNIKPLIGIIPNCKDPELMIDSPKEDYWEYVHTLVDRGYVFAMHGYEHRYDIKKYGLVNRSNMSEFAGHPYFVQKNKIYNGKKILEDNGIFTDIFFAPSHSYDYNTLRALKDVGFKYISDGKTSKKIIRKGINCIPCRHGGVPSIRKKGLYTAVFHCHEWTVPEKAISFVNFKNICFQYKNDCVDFYEFEKSYKRGNYIFQSFIERCRVLYDRKFQPYLSKWKRSILKQFKSQNKR